MNSPSARCASTARISSLPWTPKRSTQPGARRLLDLRRDQPGSAGRDALHPRGRSLCDAAGQKNRAGRKLARQCRPGRFAPQRRRLRHRRPLPSLRPLDRSFLQSLEQKDAATPVALSVSGLWIERHAEDFRWLRREKAEGRLAISFVNHSYHHPYRPGLSDGQNFLLVPGLDRQSEILDVERLLIANGETPSVFFRFPGLISDRAWMDILKADHLIPLGSDAWLALLQEARPGAIVLIHANGNEPFGLSRFRSLQKTKTLPRPFRPINQAP